MIPSASSKASAPRLHWNGTPLRVLLAEDNPANQQLAAILLGKMGHHVTLSSNGEEACEAFSREIFDVVLMDIQMPILDGVAALKRLRDHEAVRGGAPTPVVAVTAHALAGDREKFLDKGFDGYLSKPFRIEALVSELKAATRS